MKKAIKKEEVKRSIYIPRAQLGEDSNLFVSVNGVNYIIPKGKTSLVPECVFYEIERKNLAEINYEKLRDRRNDN